MTDYYGNELRVDDMVIFNAAADYYRESYVVGWITKISPTNGAILIRSRPIMYHIMVIVSW
jgi:hypothetical protein